MVFSTIRYRCRRFCVSFLGMLCLSGFLTFIVSMTVYFAMKSTLPGAYGAYQLSQVVVQPLKKGQRRHKIFTFRELQQFDGRDPKKPLLLSLRGVVFDVTYKDGEKTEYFNYGAPWHYMLGHDITRGTARRTFDRKYLDNMSEEYLSDDEKSTLDHEFLENYMKSYKVYGYMDFFYRENWDQFDEDDDEQIDEEVYVSKEVFTTEAPPSKEEIEKSQREAKEAEERVDRQLKERWDKYREEHPNGEDEL